jgi:hypothetical protein
VGLRLRLERLEGAAGYTGQAISREALKALSDEDLEALEDVLEERETRGGADEDLYATERGRRALDAYTYAREAIESRRQRDPA